MLRGRLRQMPDRCASLHTRQGKLTAELLGQLPGGVRAVVDFALRMDTATDAAQERAKADHAPAEAARDVASSLSNIPEGFRLFNAALARYEAQAGVTQQPPLPPPPPRIVEPRIPRERVDVEAEQRAGLWRRTIDEATERFREGAGTSEQALATFRATVEGVPGPLSATGARLDAVALQSLRTTAALASLQVGLESAARATERAQSAAAPIAAPARAQVVVRDAAPTERVVVHETVTHDNRRLTLQVFQQPGEDQDTFVRRVIAAIEAHNFTQTGDTQAPLPTRG